MIESEVARRFAEAKAAGHAYMLVCFGTFDRLRGDDDLGYYYPALDSAEAVRDYIARHQVGTWDPTRTPDFCEAVIDLNTAGATFSPSICEGPVAWLARHFTDSRER